MTEGPHGKPDQGPVDHKDWPFGVVSDWSEDELRSEVLELTENPSGTFG